MLDETDPGSDLVVDTLIHTDNVSAIISKALNIKCFG